jgi:hypothetical protein
MRQRPDLPEIGLLLELLAALHVATSAGAASPVGQCRRARGKEIAR